MHQREVSGPEAERQEIRYIYASKGFTGELLDQVVDTITGNRDAWLATMMTTALIIAFVLNAAVLFGVGTCEAVTLTGDCIGRLFHTGS